MEIRDCFLGSERLGYVCKQRSLYDLTISVFRDGILVGSFEVTILRSDKELSTMTFTVNHQVHTALLDKVKPHASDVRLLPLEEVLRCTVFTDTKAAKIFQEQRVAPAIKSENNDFFAPLSGRIVQVLVKPGDYVSPQTPLLIVESMKMENVLYAPREAFVKNLFIGIGDVVKQFQRLITFKASGEAYGTVEAPGRQEEISHK